MNDVTIRFLEVLSLLKTNDIVKSNKDFANIIGVSTSLLTEMSKGRTKVGVDAIQNTVNKFNIDSNWFFTGKPDGYLEGYFNGYLNRNVHEKVTIKGTKNIVGDSNKIKTGSSTKIKTGKVTIGEYNDLSKAKEPVTQYNYFNSEFESVGLTLDINVILDRIKLALNIEKDIELANLMDVKAGTFSAWRSRNSVDLEAILKLAKLKNIDLYYIFHGESMPGITNGSENQLLKDEIKAKELEIIKLTAQIDMLKSLINK